MATPQQQAYQDEDQQQPEPLTDKTTNSAQEGRPTGIKGWVTAESYIPNRTANNAPKRTNDKVSEDNILSTPRPRY